MYNMYERNSFGPSSMSVIINHQETSFLIYPHVYRHVFKFGKMAAIVGMIPARKYIFPVFHDAYHSR